MGQKLLARVNSNSATPVEVLGIADVVKVIERLECPFKVTNFAVL